MSRWFAGFALGLVVLPAAPTSSLAGQISKARAEAERFAARVEDAEWGSRALPDPSEALRQVERGLAAVDEHLRADPDDPDALILRVRLMRIRSLFSMDTLRNVPGEGWTLEGAMDHDSLQAMLDRVLELDPTRADAHYWKARLYGMTQVVLRDGEPVVAADPDRARYHARRAVELDPGSAVYRQTLAIHLAADQLEEAAAVMREVDGGRHPVSRLLDDLLGFPLPEEAKPEPDRAATLAEMMGSGGWPYSYPGLRVRVWTFARPWREVAAFYEAQWPGVRFFRGDELGEGGGVDDGGVALVDSRGRPVTDPRRAAKLLDGEFDGMVLMLMVSDGPGETAPATMLVLQNQQKVGG